MLDPLRKFHGLCGCEFGPSYSPEFLVQLPLEQVC